ncbi:MAG: T9SS type A sorting domain-containing protein [Paludibacter sp.]|jgi:hypothetical protein
MKKITFILALCAFALIGKAQVLLDETFFDFPTTDNTATVNGWTNYSGNTLEPNLTDSRTLDKAGLQYADLSGVPFLSGQGAALHNVYVGLSATKNPPGTVLLTSKPFSTTPITTGVIYTSFLFQSLAPGGSQGQTVSLTDSIHRSAMCLWVRPGASGSTFKLGITRSGGGSSDIVNGLTEFNYGTVNFIVMKYDFTSHIAYLYVNPPVGSASEPTEYAFDNASVNPLEIYRTAMQYVMLTNKGSNKCSYYVSGIRVCQSWADAVQAAALPKVTAPTVGSASGVDVESFWANWTPTTTSNGYTILVYSGTSLFSKTNVTDKTASTFQVSGLVSNTTYTYKVQANGDLSTTGNSDPSAASASFTTKDGVLSVQPNFSDGTWGPVYTASTGINPEPAALSYPSAANGNYFVSNGLNSSVQKIGIFLDNTLTVRDTLKYWIKLDKSTAAGGSYLALPSMKQVGSMQLHVFSGSKTRPLLVQELISNGSWQTDYSLVTGKDSIASNNDTIYTLHFNKSVGTKLRIINTGGGFLGIGKVSVDAVLSGLIENTSNISLYSTGKTIVSSQPGTLSVYNLQGILVYKEAIENRRLTNLSAGIYIVRLKATDGNMTTRKILIN